ncbi:beta-alanine--pyruvate transaminase [Rhodopseudomonas julia]|uniref:Beta-alanine--pyruvate transaminase n=1 Tax=Rhodopseudomonas julia TaxID=200617 RepID=A0ABU0C5G9_9BRAD|nr:aspartate aminotransferase family protein [Rhodopseudomonas julia]MDQ0325194.1 beta-alanine--pyruvate transaminase [Rhodopseudomonas julia]
MNMLAEPLQKFATNSLESHWLPFTASRDFKAEPRLVVKSEGMYLWDHKGGKIIDGSSALFNVAAGHGRKEIIEAVHAQMLQNDYSPHFQLGHPGSFALSAKLSQILPEPFNHIFFVNSGSEAIDTALKIVMAYHRARGEGQRLRFVSRERAYHGVNIGGVSLSGLMKNREAFPGVIPNVVAMRHTWDSENTFVRGQPETGAELAEDLQRFCDMYGASTIAAVFVEPVAGSTGTLVPPKGYLERLREICDENGILLVFDEVITGFGRLGAPFAAQAFGVTPDIMTMAKAITNGTIPMGAVAARDEIYETITNSAPENAIEFFHGYTYSAHPVACAAGLATLDIYEREGLFDRAADLSGYFLDAIYSLKDIPAVRDIRGYGMMAGVEAWPEDGKPGVRGNRLQKELFWKGLHVKFTGDTAIVAPPLIAEKSHVDEMVDILRQTLSVL